MCILLDYVYITRAVSTNQSNICVLQTSSENVRTRKGIKSEAATVPCASTYRNSTPLRHEPSTLLCQSASGISANFPAHFEPQNLQQKQEMAPAFLECTGNI